MIFDDETAEPQVPPSESGEAAEKARGGSASRMKSNLVAIGSAAVLTVYAAGFMRTRTAAARFANESSARRPVPSARADTTAEVAAAPVPTTLPRRDTVVTPAANVPKATRPVRAAKAENTEKPAEAIASPAPASTPIPAPAPAPIAPAAVVDSSPTRIANAADSAAKAHVGWKDGLYFGWGTSRHGDIQAGVEIKDGKITSAFISECLTQYSCSWVAALPPQVVARQSADVDYVSGATQSTNALYYAVVEALKKAK